MMKPFVTGMLAIFAVVIAFVVAMNVVPVDSAYFIWVIVGYVVLFPAALAYTIIASIRGAKRLMAGGDPALKERGERTMATVLSARPLNMTMRVNGGPRLQMLQVRLKPDNRTPEISTTKTAQYHEGAPEAGDRVPVYLDRDNAKNMFVDWALSSGAARLAGGGQIGDFVAQMQAAVAQAGRQAAAPAMGEHALEGRARIEGLKPFPDGTYDLDLHVTPRSKSSYRVATRVQVPAGVGLLERGQTLKVRIDPDIASRVEIVWDRDVRTPEASGRRD